ncbi:response regulator transcription factor [Streptomyces sp. yr375]|uniref:response regulator transcription factor n=1 Tax=Streptomyces sp. yr375 TaxID=1761906 RepID=UPI0015A50116|nr:response regulator transcription factor [Streptomyces sp. yr375]
MKTILSRDPGISVVAEAADEREALRRIAECRADVVLLEAGLAETIQDLAKSAPAPPYGLVYGIECMAPEKLAALVRGNVRAIVHRDARHDELVRAVRAVTSGDGFASQELTGCLLQAVRAGVARPGVDHRFKDRLTDRENGVLGLLCQGLSNKAIAAALSVSEKTVKFHVSNVLAKSGVSTRTQLIAAVGPFGTPAQRAALHRFSA